jgi:hypothetical protein
VLRIAAYLLALLSFAAATLLSSAPAVAPAPPPTAEAVRRARDSAVELAMVVAADGTPRRLQLAERDLRAAATLVGHGVEGLRLRPALAADRLTLDTALQLAGRTWLNARTEVVPAAGFPAVHLRVGAWRVPPAAVERGLALLDRLLRRRAPDLPPIASMVSGVAITPRAASATLSVPQRLFRALGELRGRPESGVDERLLRHVYGRLLEFEVRQPQASFAMTLRQAFADRPAGIDAVDYNRAAFVALAMHTVGPRVRRLAGSGALRSAPQEIAPPELRVGGRPDLAKHFALSAALAATLEPRFTRAMGEWKELDDSLPGGSGFSFVDLTADRAGLHLARAATDPATAALVAARLADTSDTALFPNAAHRLAEGLTEAQFGRRYGGLGSDSYALAVKRVDRLLARLPLYADLVRP